MGEVEFLFLSRFLKDNVTLIIIDILSMARTFFILFITVLLVSCTGKQPSNSDPDEKNSDSVTGQNEFVQDTIPERNNPKSVDLTKHQLFIDTTRTSEFYERLKNWKESDGDRQSISASLKAIDNNFQPVEAALKQFPMHFITLRKLNGSFILYDRCDGMDQRFEIRDTVFIFYGPLESEAGFISKIITRTANAIDLELRIFQFKSNDQRATVKLEKIDDSIFKMTYRNQTFDDTIYVTTPDKLQEFDLLVSHCPTEKMSEFAQFDEKVK
jgi:hypothetical protein